MPHKISILVRADVGRDALELFLTGCLTADTIGILTRQIGKARDLDPAAPILVDLTGAQHLESEALDQLRLQTKEVGGHPEPSLRLATPQTRPTCPHVGTDHAEVP